MNLTGEIINNKYSVIKKIGEGGMSIVWLAQDINSFEHIAIKVLKKDASSERIEDIIRFKNEATTISKLSVHGIVKIIEVGEYKNNPFIAMEYVNGKSLYELFQDGLTFSIAESVEIISQVCESLRHVHNSNIIHRDLKPGNIILSMSNEDNIRRIETKLIDFGLAQIKEYNSKETSTAGTFYYMSPEQIGSINKTVDERSDLYSLGIVFYQLLSGTLPFSGENINTIIHQHIAKVPEPLISLNTNIPKIIDKMVSKLLEKEPEKRYQSIDGLLYDLKLYKSGKTDFEIAMHDNSIKLNYRTNMIGRDKELDILKSKFHEASNSEGSICFLSGGAGKGKTRLIEEFKNYVGDYRALFLYGKCISSENKIPYGPINDALNSYLKIFVKLSSEERSSVLKKINEFIGNLAAIILKINPYMDEIFGDCPQLVELLPEREKDRFRMVIDQFFRALSEVHGAVVLVLEDLQWVDEGSLDLLNGLLSNVSKNQLFIVATYRNDEINVDHPLKDFCHRVKETQEPFSEIALNAFDLNTLNKFIAGLLFEKIDNTNEISEFILQRSNGDPFFSIEILKEMIKEGALFRDEKTWRINRNLIESLQLPTTIIDIILKRIYELNDNEIYVLSYAAVIGKNIDINFLFDLLESEKKEILDIIDKAVRIQILKYSSTEKGIIEFYHTRIKEAFYQDLDSETKKDIHLKIADILEYTNKINTDKVVFDLAFHYQHSGNIEKALEYVYPAGIKSKESHANFAAAGYFTEAIIYIEAKGQYGSPKWIECIEKAGECYQIIGQSNAALDQFNKVLSYKKDNLEKAKIYLQISNTYFKQGDKENCETSIKKGMEHLGVKMPQNNAHLAINIFKELAIQIIISLLRIDYSKGNKQN
ncbi:MAG: protein kinase, partial [Bacillota bacterium]|nr:protein kinase [Bacillota bacterium]